MGIVLPGLVPLSLAAVVWAIWLRRRRGEEVGWLRFAPWLAAAPLLGFLWTLFGLARAFHAVAYADAAYKQTLLAEGIQQAMIGTAAGFVLLAAVAVALAVETVRSWRSGPP